MGVIYSLSKLIIQSSTNDQTAGNIASVAFVVTSTASLTVNNTKLMIYTEVRLGLSDNDQVPKILIKHVTLTAIRAKVLLQHTLLP